jgi:hypothetical protein
MADLNNPTPAPILAVKVAESFVARAKALEVTIGRGVKRDRAALEFVCGAAAGVSAASPEGDQSPEYKSLELMAFMVATRGYAFIEEIVARGPQP